jgi:hypothetical protein
VEIFKSPSERFFRTHDALPKNGNIVPKISIHFPESRFISALWPYERKKLTPNLVTRCYSRRHGMWDCGATAQWLIRRRPTAARPRFGPLAFDAVRDDDPNLVQGLEQERRSDLRAETQAGAIAQAALNPVERVVLQGPPQNLDGVSFVERFEETNDLRLIIGQRATLLSSLQPAA